MGTNGAMHIELYQVFFLCSGHWSCNISIYKYAMNILGIQNKNQDRAARPGNHWPTCGYCVFGSKEFARANNIGVWQILCSHNKTFRNICMMHTFIFRTIASDKYVSYIVMVCHSKSVFDFSKHKQIC